MLLSFIKTKKKKLIYNVPSVSPTLLQSVLNFTEGTLSLTKVTTTKTLHHLNFYKLVIILYKTSYVKSCSPVYIVFWYTPIGDPFIDGYPPVVWSPTVVLQLVNGQREKSQLQTRSVSLMKITTTSKVSSVHTIQETDRVTGLPWSCRVIFISEFNDIPIRSPPSR